MINILIVDDEPTIRKGLVDTICWNEYGAYIVGCAKNGIEAIEYCKYHSIDIIISDIKMPKMDGIQLLEAVKTDFPQIYFIIISGYDEFELAHKAINLGAYAYILKPIEPQDLLNTIIKIKEAMVNNLTSKTLINNNIIRDSILGLYKPEVYHAFSDLINYLSKFYYCIITIQYNSYKYFLQDIDINDIQNSFDNFNKLFDITDDNLFAYNLGPGNTVVCGSNQDLKTLNKIIDCFSEKIYNKIIESNISISLGIGQAYKGIEKINISYIQSLKALNYTFISTDKRVCKYTKDLSYTSNIIYEYYTNENEIIELLMVNDIESIRSKLLNVLENMKCNKTSIYDIELFIRNILYKAINAITEADISVNNILDNPYLIFQEIFAQVDYKCKFNLLIVFLEKIGNNLTMFTREHVYSLLAKVKQHINENFSDSSLSLVSVASYVHIHPVYLSAVFTKHEEISFIDYLTNIRIKKAKYLLKHSSHKISTITHMVGYQNSSYFSTLFKKIVGHTPSCYRQLNDTA